MEGMTPTSLWRGDWFGNSSCEVFESTQFGHYTRSRPRLPLGDAKSRKLLVYMRFPWSA
jgi:hypothetical protein